MFLVVLAGFVAYWVLCFMGLVSGVLSFSFLSRYLRDDILDQFQDGW